MRFPKIKSILSVTFLILLILILMFRGLILSLFVPVQRMPFTQILPFFGIIIVGVLLFVGSKGFEEYRRRLVFFKSTREFFPVTSTTLTREQAKFVVTSLEHVLNRPKSILGILQSSYEARRKVVEQLRDSVRSSTLREEQLDTLNSVLLCPSKICAPLTKWWDHFFLDSWYGRLVKFEKHDVLSDEDLKCTLETIQKLPFIESHLTNQDKAACAVLPDSGHIFSVTSNDRKKILVLHTEQGKTVSRIVMHGQDVVKKESVNCDMLSKQKEHLFLLLKLISS